MFLGKGVVIGRSVPLIFAMVFANAKLAVHSLVDIVVTRLELVPPPASPSGQPLGIAGKGTKPGQAAFDGQVFVMHGGFWGWHD
jgi:hypothetical protein